MTNTINLSSVRILGAYGCGAYGANTYNGQCTTGTGDGGFLADTGYSLLLPMALGVALIIAAVILLVKRIVRRRSANS